MPRPSQVPPLAELDALTDDEVGQVVNWYSTQNTVVAGAQFWIDELGRRRTEGVLRRIADTTAENADHVAAMVTATEEGSRQNARMVGLNDRMVNLTKVIAWLTVASVLLSGTALVVALTNR